METLNIAATATLTHGWSMADVDRAARVAVRKHTHSNGILDDSEREALAWHGVVEHLYECGCGWGSCNRPTGVSFHDLLHAAWGALDKEVSDHLRHHGQRGAREGHAAPRFSQYWGTAETHHHTLPSRKPKHRDGDNFTDRVCERIALAEALGALSVEHYEALATLAAYDNAAGPAADALGMKYQGYMSRVYTARKKVAEVWFGDEQPAAPKKNKGDTCRVGHSRAEHGRLKADGAYECRLCKKASERRRRARVKQQAVS